jgi:hypothetical protein
VARHPCGIERAGRVGGARARCVAHLDRDRLLAGGQPLHLGDADVAREHHGDAAVGGAAVVQRVEQDALEAHQVVRVGLLDVTHAAAADQVHQADDAAGMAVGGGAGFGRRLRAGHPRGAVVEHQQHEAGAVIDGVFQARRAGMEEGAVADGGEDRRRPAVLLVGVVEARCHGDRGAHVVHGVHRALVEPQRVAADVAGEQRVGEGATQFVEHRAMAAAGAQRRPPDRQLQGRHGLAQRIGRALARRQAGLLRGCGDQAFDHRRRQLAVARHMAGEPAPDRDAEADLHFHGDVGFFQH